MAKKQTKKTNVKTKKETKEKPVMGEQMDLLDIHPQSSKKILGAARRYKKALRERLAALAIEKNEKQNILDFAKQEKLQRLPNGFIRFKVADVTVVIKPQDDKVEVTFDEDKSADED